MRIGSFTLGKNGADACGDVCGFVHHQARSQVLLWMIDGLGHGLEAQSAAEFAQAIMISMSNEKISEILQECNRGLKTYRGAAIGLVEIYIEESRVRYCGIGNTRCIHLSNRHKHFAGQAGIVGDFSGKIIVEDYQCKNGDKFLLFTDGLPDSLEIIESVRDEHGAFDAKCKELVTQFGSANDDCGVLLCEI